MKRVLAFLAAIAVMVCLTACGTVKTNTTKTSEKTSKSETLNCTKEETDDDGLAFNQDVTAIFENNKVTNLDMKIDVVLDESMKSYADMMKDALANEYKSFSDNGAKVDFSVNENIVTISISMDVKNMTKDQLKQVDMEDVYGTKKETKKAFEAEGYTCK